jgi:phospholipase/carboxylesterase
MISNANNIKFYEYSKKLDPKYLVVFLHGYGANGQNLISLADDFAEILPNALYLSPNAVEAWEGGFPNAYQWFSLYDNLQRKNLLQLSFEIKNANKILQEFLDLQLKKLNLNHSNLILIGFSQGSMMANYQAMISKQPLAGVISYSGKIIEPTSIGEKIISKTKTCLIHGKQDSVLDFNNFLDAKNILTNLQIPFEAHGLDNLDHGIDHRGIKIAKQFIKSIIN